MSDIEPIVFGDPILRLDAYGKPMIYVGDRAASDPWEAAPGLWQIAVRSTTTGTIFFVALDEVRKAVVPDAVLALLVDDDTEGT